MSSMEQTVLFMESQWRFSSLMVHERERKVAGSSVS